tara:strand:+ start:150 stop:1190 length:1041 start_codon:yes stop_codon:yes gene_type:complete
MSEIDIIQKAKPNLSAKTLANYHNLYKRLKEVIGNKDVSSLDNKEIIDKVNEVKGKSDKSATPAIKSNLLSLAMTIKKELKLNVDSLKQAIKDTHKEVKSYTAEKNVDLKTALPSLKALTSYTNNLFAEEKWKPYIMNWLMMEMGVRNKDLMLEFGDAKTEINPDKNYLIVNKNSVKYIRGDYKTKDTYGDQKKNITNKKFITAVKNAMETENDGKYLLSLGGNKEIAETSLNKFVSKHTLDNMGQSKIFKVVIDARPKKKEALAATRGTALGTVAEHYDIKFKDEVGKVAKESMGLSPQTTTGVHGVSPLKKKFKKIPNPNTIKPISLQNTIKPISLPDFSDYNF